MSNIKVLKKHLWQTLFSMLLDKVDELEVRGWDGICRGVNHFCLYPMFISCLQPHSCSIVQQERGERRPHSTQSQLHQSHEDSEQRRRSLQTSPEKQPKGFWRDQEDCVPWPRRHITVHGGPNRTPSTGPDHWQEQRVQDMQVCVWIGLKPVKHT